MQLLHKTNDSARAHAIQHFLERRGVPAAVHGVQSARALPVGFVPNTLSLWVIKDQDLPGAEKLLAEFFAEESPPTGAPAAKPLPKGLRFVLLAGITFMLVLLACAAAYGT
jgi:hypothetical protein